MYRFVLCHSVIIQETWHTWYDLNVHLEKMHISMHIHQLLNNIIYSGVCTTE